MFISQCILQPIMGLSYNCNLIQWYMRILTVHISLMQTHFLTTTGSRLRRRSTSENHKIMMIFHRNYKLLLCMWIFTKWEIFWGLLKILSHIIWSQWILVATHTSTCESWICRVEFWICINILLSKYNLYFMYVICTTRVGLSPGPRSEQNVSLLSFMVGMNHLFW